MSRERDPRKPGDEAVRADDRDDGPDRPVRLDLVLWILVGLSVLSVASDFFYHKHGEFGFQEWIGFDAVYGGLASVIIVLGARGLRALVTRGEDYYD